jgi:hypothetical protein
MDVALLVARVLLAGAFALTGAAKLADLERSRRAVAEFGVHERLAGVVGVLLPVHLGVAVALSVGGAARSLRSRCCLCLRQGRSPVGPARAAPGADGIIRQRVSQSVRGHSSVSTISMTSW